MKRKIFLLFFLSIKIFVFGYNIEGVVRDALTGESLTGVSVYIKNDKSNGTITGLNGSFVLKKISSGEITLICSYLSYQTLEKTITIPSSESQKLLLNLVSYSTELNDIVVIASNKTTDIGVRNIERLSPNILNVVGARSIEISPDLTVANVLGRVSGVVMERNSSGEAEYAVLRGMDKRYNITLVNGVKISSPNNKQRYVPLNIFPSELLDRLEVIKSRSAETEGDATGGAVNMVMKDAPARFTFRANTAVGYSTLFFDRKLSSFDKSKVIETAPYEQYGNSYSATMTDFGNGFYTPYDIEPIPNITAGISVGNRLINNKLGFIIAANFQQVTKGTDCNYFENEMLYTESTVRLTSIKKRIYSESQQHYGLHAKLDYVFSKNHKIEWYNFIVANNNAQIRQSTNTNFKLFYEPDKGNLDLAYQTRMRTTNQQIFASTLQGEHQLNKKLSLNWTTLYSAAGLQRPDQIHINLDNLQQNFVDNITIDGDGSSRRWEHNSDEDLSAIVQMQYVQPFLNSKLKVQGGGLFRNKMRDNFYVNYKLKPADMNQSFERIDEINWTVYTPKGSVDQQTYSASEIVGAGYLQGRYEKSNLEITAGIRSEYTDQRYHMVFPNIGEPADGGQNYVSFLPNLQIKYSPSSKINYRALYYKSINRPGYFEIIPYQIQEEDYTEYGNKDLKHAVIDNADIRLEFFPKPTDQILIGVFFKKIHNAIEYSYRSINQRQGGYGLANLGDAQNLGLEVDIIKYIRLLGLKFNYTYTHSSITTQKIYYGKDENGNVKTLYANQTRPLVGQAEHVGNISLLFKNVNHGWNAQLAASYTGEKIFIASRYLNSDYWEKASVQLDASVEKDFKSGLSIFAKANNLLNTPKIEFIKTHNDYNNSLPLQSAKTGETLIKQEYYKPSFSIGIRYKL